MFAMTPIVGALALLLCASALAAPTAPGTTPRSLLSQAKGLPEEFEAHFFDVPLAVRMELDQQYLGEAMVVLTRDDRITLLEFTDTQDSPIPPVERGQWEQLLKQGRALGACEAKCTAGLLAVHYSLEHSLVSILTEKVERGSVEKRYYDQPQGAVWA